METFKTEELFPLCARAATALLAMELLRALARHLRKARSARQATPVRSSTAR